jgi:hypothetical protein
MRSALPHASTEKRSLSNVAELSVEVIAAGFSIERLRERADASSSVLESILNRSRPEPRWGINE